MNIPKAIELLNKDIDDPGSIDIMDLQEAEKLGIEALKYTQDVRQRQSAENYKRLPGETEK